MTTLRKKRGTPLVASRNAERALNNLLEKRNILSHMLKECSKDTSAAEQLKVLPRSIRQFNFWRGEHQWPGKRQTTVTFSSNSNETLRINIGLREEVQQLVDAVRKLGERKLVGRREDTLRALKLQLAVERRLTAIANREVVQARFLISELRDSFESVQHSKTSISEESRIRINELEVHVQTLEFEVASLRRKLRGVKTLKSV